MKALAQQFLTAVATNDTSLYLQLTNEELYTHAVRSDTALKNDLQYILNDLPQRKARHLEQFSLFVQAVRKVCGPQLCKLKLVSIKVADTFPGNYLIRDDNVEMVFKAKGKKLRFYTVISSLNGCHYFFEPVMADIEVMK